jgi:hypothetical protein
MSGQTVVKFRWFWDDADHAIEQWLEDMARQGLHLQRISCLRTVFVFKRGEPADMTYRIDFLIARKNPDYVQLFNDAGWEHVDELLGWQYWRAPKSEGRSPEIFTDVPSQIKKYQRLLWLFGVCWIPAAIIIPIKGTAAFSRSPFSTGLLVGSAFVTVYAALRIVSRIRKLREQAP